MPKIEDVLHIERELKRDGSVIKQTKKQSDILNIRGDVFNLAHEASSTGRMMSSFNAPTLSPTSAAIAENNLLIRRSQATIRNNVWVANGLNQLISDEIGNGITPISKSKDLIFKSQIEELIEDSKHQFDPQGVLCMYGIQAAAARARRADGEVFIRIRRRRPSAELNIPVQFQLIESVFCPIELNRVLLNGSFIRSGIEFNKFGKRTAYWMYTEHPHDWNNKAPQIIRVPANQIIHHYIPLRPGAIRAAPEFSQSIPKAHLYDKYTSAELTRKETRAHFTGVIHRTEYDDNDYKYDPISGQLIDEDEGEVGMIDLEPGTFPSLLPGEGVELFDSDKGSEGYLDFQYDQKAGIAAGMGGIPVEILSGDYSRINDRIARIILNQYHRGMEQIQNLYTIQQVCRAMYETIVMTSVQHQLVDTVDFASNIRDYIRAEHRIPSWAYVHPLQDVQAHIHAMNAKLDSRQNIVSKRSRNVNIVDLEIQEDNLREISLGINEITGENND